MKYVIDIPTEYYEVIKKIPVETYTADMLVIANGKPLDDVLDEIRAEIPKLVCCENEYRQALVRVADVIKCIDKHRAESEPQESEE